MRWQNDGIRIVRHGDLEIEPVEVSELARWIDDLHK